MSHQFKPGDKVVCISTYNGNKSFIKGKIYIVKECCDPNWPNTIRIVADEYGRENGWHKDYFVDEARYTHNKNFQKKIQELINE